MTTLLSIALGLLLQSTALLLLGLVVMRFARRRGPAVQSLIGRATLAGVGLALLLAGPLAGHVRPVWRVTVGEPTPRQVAAPPETGGGGVKASAAGYSLDGTYRHRAAFTDAAPNASADPAPGNSTRPDMATASPDPPPPPVSGGAATCRGVGSLWAAGTALLLLWLAFCQCHLTRLRRQASPIASGPAAEALAALTTHPPALFAHPSVRSPFLAGLRHPAIFLPTAYETEFDPTALHAILAHELAHLARCDNAWILAARLLTALLWPQPLLWLLCRRLEQTGEEACDLSVLAQDCPPRAYAECLLTLAERHPLGRRERALGVGVAPFRSSLGRRISRILDKGTHAMSAVTPRLRLTVAALAVAAALGGVFLVAAAPAQPRKMSGTDMNKQFSVTPVPETVSSTSSGGVETSASLMRQLDLARARLVEQRSGLRDAVMQAMGIKRKLEHVEQAHKNGQHSSQATALRWAYNNAQNKMVAVERATAFLQLKLDSLKLKQEIAASKQQAAASDASAAQLSSARFLAGLTPVQGPGVVVTLRDSHKPFPPMPTGMAPPSIIHDTDINAVVNELKAAGAEAIAVNGQRLVATSSIRTAGPTALINFVPTAPPYIIKAIGGPKTLASAMNLPGGVASQIKAFDPAMFSVKQVEAMFLPAYLGGSNPRYAKPITTAFLEADRQRTDVAYLLKALTQQRGQLQAKLSALDAQATAITAETRILRRQAAQVGGTTSPSHNISKRNQTDPEMRALASQLAAAQADLGRKEATLTPMHPAVIAAKRKVKALERAYQEQPIREKQEFVKQVHQQFRQQVPALVALANAEGSATRQLNNVQRQRRQLQGTIAFLDAQIARHNAPASSH